MISKLFFHRIAMISLYCGIGIMSISGYAGLDKATDNKIEKADEASSEWQVALSQASTSNLPFSDDLFKIQFDQLAHRLADKLKQAGKKRIVVDTYYNPNGRVSSLGRQVADALDASLSNIPQKSFDVVNRKHLEALTKEHELGLMGLLRFGADALDSGFSGADVVIVGSIIRMPDHFLVISKGIDTDTGRIVFADSKQWYWLARMHTADELFRSGISGRDIFRNMPTTARFKSNPTFEIGKESAWCQGYGVFRTIMHAMAKYCHDLPRGSATMTCTMKHQKEGNGAVSRSTQRITQSSCPKSVDIHLLEDLGIDPRY